MSYRKINISEAKIVLEDSKAILADIRDHESYNDSHDPKSIHLTQEVLPSFLENTQKNIPILIMCYHGNSSQMVAEYLSSQGFTDVYSIDGGYEEWVI